MDLVRNKIRLILQKNNYESIENTFRSRTRLSQVYKKYGNNKLKDDTIKYIKRVWWVSLWCFLTKGGFIVEGHEIAMIMLVKDYQEAK